MPSTSHRSAASRRPLKDVRNGWIFPLALGSYGQDHLMRATVAFGGYANQPEETVYAALTADARGRPLTGDRRYRLRFAPDARPPVGARSRGGQPNDGGAAGSTVSPNNRAMWPTSTGLAASRPDGPPKSTIDVTAIPA